MPAIYLTERDVDNLLTVKECVPVIEEAMRHLGTGDAVNQPRRRLRGGGYALQIMSSNVGPMGYVGFKAYGFGPGARTPMKVYLYSTQTGEVLAVLDANRLGAIRTGSATGVGTKYQARADAKTLGVFGSGNQARTQVEAVCAVRPIEQVWVYSRTPEHRETFAAEMAARLGIAVTAVAAPEEAAQADVVVTITNAQQPVLKGEWLRPGAHVNAAGGNSLIRGEVDAETVRRAAIVTADSVEDAKLESADLMRAVEAGAINWEQVRELGHVVAGYMPGRTGDDQITLFNSQGLALWDVAAAGYVYRKAVEQGVGVSLPF